MSGVFRVAIRDDDRQFISKVVVSTDALGVIFILFAFILVHVLLSVEILASILVGLIYIIGLR